MPLLRAQIEQLDRRAGEVTAAALDHFVETAVLVKRGKRRVSLRRVTNRDRAAPRQLRAGPADDRLDDGWVSDNVLPLAGAGVALVVFLDPVRLQHDTVMWADIIIRQTKCIQRLANERVNGGGIVIVVDPAKGRDARGIQLSICIHSFSSANSAARIFSPNARRVKCRRN